MHFSLPSQAYSIFIFKLRHLFSSQCKSSIPFYHISLSKGQSPLSMSPSNPILASALLAQSQSQFLARSFSARSHLHLPTDPLTSIQTGSLIGILDSSIISTPSSYPRKSEQQPAFSFLTRLIVGYLLQTQDSDERERQSSGAKVILLVPPIDSLPTTHALHPSTLASALSALSSPDSAVSDHLARIILHQYLSLPGLLGCLADLKSSFANDDDNTGCRSLVVLAGLQPLLDGIARKENHSRVGAAVEEVLIGLREALEGGKGCGVIELQCEEMTVAVNRKGEKEGGRYEGEEEQQQEDEDGDEAGFEAGLDGVLRLDADSGEGIWR